MAMTILRSADIKAIAKQVAAEMSEQNDTLLNINVVAEMLGKTRAAKEDNFLSTSIMAVYISAKKN